MVYNGNKVLVQDRVNTDWKGITFLGGHVEKGESLTDAVVREVFEETGLTIYSPQLCGIKDWTNDDGLSEFYYYKENGQWCYKLK